MVGYGWGRKWGAAISPDEVRGCKPQMRRGSINWFLVSVAEREERSSLSCSRKKTPKSRKKMSGRGDVWMPGCVYYLEKHGIGFIMAPGVRFRRDFTLLQEKALSASCSDPYDQGLPSCQTHASGLLARSASHGGKRGGCFMASRTRCDRLF